MIIITLTEPEVNMIAYALREIGSRRSEQAVEIPMKAEEYVNCLKDADTHFTLSDRLYSTLPIEQSEPSNSNQYPHHD